MGMGSGGYESRRRGFAKPKRSDVTMQVCPKCGLFHVSGDKHKCDPFAIRAEVVIGPEGQRIP